MRFTTKYVFSHRHEEIVNYLDRVHSKSYRYYMDNIYRAGLTSTLNVDLECLTKSMEYLTDYLYYYDRCLPRYDFDKLFDTIKSKLDVITVLPKDQRGIFGQFVEEDKAVLINPELPSSRTLTGKERTRLYLYHELGHIINSEWMSTVLDYVNNTDEPIEVKQMMYDGFSLVDEVTTQERAEVMTYYFARKRRPELAKHRNRVYGGELFNSNFDFYGEMQDPAYMFARTLRGIGSSETMDEALKRLADRTLKADFAKRVFNEYERDGHIDELYLLLMYMGIIKNASYAAFGYSEEKYLGMSKEMKEKLDDLTRPLRDYRNPYSY